MPLAFTQEDSLVNKKFSLWWLWEGGTVKSEIQVVPEKFSLGGGRGSIPPNLALTFCTQSLCCASGQGSRRHNLENKPVHLNYITQNYV